MLCSIAAYRRRRCGLAMDLLEIWYQLSVHIGFEACLSDTAFDNIEAIQISFDSGLIGIGSLPGAMLSRNSNRCSDIIILFRSLGGIPSFKTRVTDRH
jgi:hypothetical protein